MHWLLNLACVLALRQYSQQDYGGLVSIWTTEWSAAWGDIQETSSSRVDQEVQADF